MKSVLFSLALAALTTLNGLLALTIFTDILTLWPTPGRRSWQDYTFWALFRGGLGLTFVLAIVEFVHGFNPHWVALAIGVALMVVGFGFTVYGYFELGLDNTYGSNDRLVTTGLYAYSRNPQYVASISGLVGLAIACRSWPVAALCAMAVLVYVLLPLAEEPWLSRVYGRAYDDYRAVTPRFVSLCKLREAIWP